jgi:hypothetical protein
MFLFTYWFVRLALPKLKRSPGKKLLIGTKNKISLVGR